MPDLLIELLSEEIPARMQMRAAEDLKRLMTDGLVDAGLTYAGSAAFSTPRRLALTIQGLSGSSNAVREERKGPRVDAPEKALNGFLRATGLRLEDLEQRPDKKGDVWFAVIERPGRAASEIVAEVLGQVVQSFPWPKSMRWGSSDLRWVRPLQSMICLLTDESGAAVVDVQIDGLRAGDQTRGHRFMSPDTFSVTGFDDYDAKLRRAHVVLSAQTRADTIRHDAENSAFARGMELIEDQKLLSEVAGLVEWPVVLMGDIGAEFLELPPEVLQTSMREHQKFFSVRNPATSRIEKFVTVANRDTADDGKTILAGNIKVLAARLSDAKFFWENDLRTVEDIGLEGMARPLAQVTFHNKLGTQADRIDRVAALARDIAPLVGADPDTVEKAARICKADLASEMVYEFPELQGVMGRYYAKSAGLGDGIPEACEDHYAPLGPSDAVPTAPVSVAVALADKIDTLTGFWSIDETPTGSRDPFALRRAALGVIRILLQNELRLSLDPLFNRQILRHAIESSDADIASADVLREILEEIAKFGVFGAAYRTVRDRVKTPLPAPVEKAAADVPDTSARLLAFFHDRLKVYLRDHGLPHDVIDACLSMPGSDDLTLLERRARALAAFLESDDGENLLQGFKRANNILTQAEEADGVEYSFGGDSRLAESDAEKAMFSALDREGAAISSAIEAEDFASAMQGMASLRAPIDLFFETVQINSDAPILRRNRLNLLHQIRETCLKAADLTRISR